MSPYDVVVVGSGSAVSVVASRHGVRRMRIPSLASTASKMLVNSLSRSRIKKRERSCADAEEVCSTANSTYSC